MSKAECQHAQNGVLCESNDKDVSRRTELMLLLRWRRHVLSLEAMDSSSRSLTHHKHYTHTPHMRTSCTHLHGHSNTTRRLRRSHTLLCGRSRILAGPHPRTHSLAHSLTPSFIHSYSLLDSLRKDDLHMWGYPVF